MKITRRFAVASLLVLAVAVVLGASPPAYAATQKLYPPTDGPFPNASGQYQVSYNPISPGAAWYLNSVSVSKLAPNTSYYIPLCYVSWYYDLFRGWLWRWELQNCYFQTDARGAYKSAKFGGGATLYGVAVYDSSTGTLVLR